MRTRIAVATLAAASLLSAPALAADPVISKMSLVGTATVHAAPDMATLTSGVVTQAQTARDALSRNTAAMSSLIDVLKKAGIADKDLQTSGFSVAPQYVYSRDKDAQGYAKPPKIVGYQVSNQLSVRVRDLDRLGTVLDSMVSAGSNTIGGVSFSVADSHALENQARTAAMKDAIAKARLYAAAADVCPSSILSISESGGVRPELLTARTMSAMSDKAEPVPVQAGEVGYSANVSVTWQLTQGPCT